MTIEAITTVYKNHRFRSRTEARWAVFFDALGLRWSYEEQGFFMTRDGKADPTATGIWYLPDFWLPELHAWVEIKGKDPTEEESRKAQALANASRNQVLLLAGQPQDPKYRHKDEGSHWLFTPNGSRALSPDQFAAGFGFTTPRAPALLNAYGVAMGARFEHGESPRARYLNR